MPLSITSLNSGSNGNCYYVGNDEYAVLIDAGISCAEIEIRMERLGLALEKVKAIFLSHEHSDHVQGIPKLVKKYKLPLFVTKETYQAARIHLPQQLVQPFRAHEPVSIGDLKITAFPKWHDAVDPHSFIVEDAEVTIGIFTDIGSPCEHVKNYFVRCHAAFLETNYDEEKLDKGSYPYILKKRIRSNEGHLSNHQALELFVGHHSTQLSHLLLSHLSQENNHPGLVESLFLEHAGNVRITVASRLCETPVFTIHAQHETRLGKPIQKHPEKPAFRKAQVQLKLF